MTINDPRSGFVLNDYRSVMTHLMDAGYACVRLPDLRPDEAHVYLRHDVDLSIEHAVEMAMCEAELGVTSTYFILVSTDIYNPASAKSRGMMAEIIALGHDIGLHFDVTQMIGDDIDIAADRECDILSALTGRAVETVSFHRPAPQLLNREGRIAGRRHTYEPAFFSQIAYVSDSNGGWHHGYPLDHPAIAAGTAIQLLTHPIWWTGDGVRDAVPLVRRHAELRMRALDDAIAGTITAYAKSRVGG